MKTDMIDKNVEFQIQYAASKTSKQVIQMSGLCLEILKRMSLITLLQGFCCTIAPTKES